MPPIRIGYPCINLSLKCRPSRTFRLASLFRAHLRAEAQRHDPRVQEMLARGAAALEARLARIAGGYDLIEERLTDEDYLQASLTLTDFLFWREEEAAWRWLTPRFVEALAYQQLSYPRALPAAFSGLADALLQEYLQACQKAKRKPDRGLVEEVRRILR